MMGVVPAGMNYDEAIGVLRSMLGQRVTVMVAASRPKSPLVASFSGELKSGPSGVDIFVVGGRNDRGFGQIVMDRDAFERATLGATGLVVVVGGVDIVISNGRFSALLEEQ